MKQFFSAQLYVSNGAPVGSGLNIREIKATLKLPPGADLQLGTLDDPLALPELERDGQVITQPLTMDVRGLGADGVAVTDDFVARLTQRKGLTPAQIRTASRFAALAQASFRFLRVWHGLQQH